jgi:uncharacterized membrane protein YuzA (DUF378 family)
MEVLAMFAAIVYGIGIAGIVGCIIYGKCTGKF